MRGLAPFGFVITRDLQGASVRTKFQVHIQLPASRRGQPEPFAGGKGPLSAPRVVWVDAGVEVDSADEKKFL